MTLPDGYLDRTSAAPFAGQRVLLTGASGFVGGHVARQALAAGTELHTLGRGHEGTAGARHHRADLADRAATRRAVAAIAPEVVLHLASPGVAYGTASFAEMAATLPAAAEALLSAAAEQERPPAFVLVGSGFEYASQSRPIREDDPIVPSASRYGAAKAAASALAGGFAGMLPLTVLRPFNIYGAGDTAPRLGEMIVAKARAGEPIALTAGEQLRDFLHVDDFGRLLWEAAGRADPAFLVCNTGSGDPLTLRRYIETLAAALAEAGHPPEVNFGLVPYRPDEPMSAVPDLTRLHAHFRWRPRVPFAQGVRDYVRWNLAR